MYVSVLGSTGSIGTQTLDVIENLNNNGYNIKVGITRRETIGIDTPADLARAEAYLTCNDEKS